MQTILNESHCRWKSCAWQIKYSNNGTNYPHCFYSVYNYQLLVLLTNFHTFYSFWSCSFKKTFKNPISFFFQIIPTLLLLLICGFKPFFLVNFNFQLFCSKSLNYFERLEWGVWYSEIYWDFTLWTCK